MKTHFPIWIANRFHFALLIVCCWLTTAAVGQTYTPGQKSNKDFDGFAKTFLSDYCVDCHSGSGAEGNLSLDELGPVDEVNAATWRSVWAQVTLKEMPPKDKPLPKQGAVANPPTPSAPILAKMLHNLPYITVEDHGGTVTLNGWTQDERERHPLEPIVNEFKRTFGELEVDLEQAEGRRQKQAAYEDARGRPGQQPSFPVEDV